MTLHHLLSCVNYPHSNGSQMYEFVKRQISYEPQNLNRSGSNWYKSEVVSSTVDIAEPPGPSLDVILDPFPLFQEKKWYCGKEPMHKRVELAARKWVLRQNRCAIVFLPVIVQTARRIEGVSAHSAPSAWESRVGCFGSERHVGPVLSPPPEPSVRAAEQWSVCRAG